MIRKLRQRHFLIWLILAIILPVLFAASIIYRHPEPVNPAIPKRINTTSNK
jgi:hypothetical protein